MSRNPLTEPTFTALATHRVSRLPEGTEGTGELNLWKSAGQREHPRGFCAFGSMRSHDLIRGT